MFLLQVAKCCTSGEFKKTLLPFVAGCMDLIFKRVGQSSLTPVGSYIIRNSVGEQYGMVSSTIPCKHTRLIFIWYFVDEKNHWTMQWNLTVIAEVSLSFPPTYALWNNTRRLTKEELYNCGTHTIITLPKCKKILTKKIRPLQTPEDWQKICTFCCRTIPHKEQILQVTKPILTWK